MTVMLTSLTTLPRISVITPSFNQGQFLEHCINSVLAQNYPNLEYIIMDGGSSDDSIAIITKYEKYLTYWQSKPDGGQYSAVEEGFRLSTGEIMVWLNSDDMYHENAFWKVASIFTSHSHVEWLTGRQSWWDENGQIKLVNFGRLSEYSRNKYLKYEYNNPFIMQENTFWRRSLWEKAGGFLRTDLEFAGDLELWVRFFRHAQLYVVDTFLGGYRVHGNQKFMLSPDLYHMEAKRIIKEELSIVGGENSLSSSPEYLRFDAEEFVSLMRTINFESNDDLRSFNSEYMIEYLLRDREKIVSSRLWRVTRPFSRLWGRIRTLCNG